MSVLKDKIHGFEHYEKKFSGWEAKEVILDENRSYWELRKPGSNCEKVCLYSDGSYAYVYGDYGVLSFDSLTFKATPKSLSGNHYDYVMGKLNYDCRKSINVYDDSDCKEDILEWFWDKLNDSYSYVDIDDDNTTKIKEFLNQQVDSWFFDEDDTEEFCDENDLTDIKDLLLFTVKALRNTDEFEWIHFLRSENLSDFDEVCESSLWEAGKRIHQRFYVNLYALQVLSEKLDMDKKENI